MIEKKIFFAKKQLSNSEAYCLKYYRKIPDPAPIDYTYWKAYLEALNYCFDLLKRDEVNQMQLLK